MAAGDITAAAIASTTPHNGFVAEIGIDSLATGGAYSTGIGANGVPAGPKVFLTITSPGYLPNGTLSTTLRTAMAVPCEHPATTGGLRKAYPNETVSDETTADSILTVRTALSDYVYTGDTVTGAIAPGYYTQSSTPNAAFSGTVVNNSTLAHPKVIAQWAKPGFEIVQDNLILEVVSFHRSGFNGKPLAAVKFEVTDGSATETSIVTTMSVSDYAGVGTAIGNKVLVYRASIPVAAFAQAAVLTANFTAYPWVGDATAVTTSATGVTTPSESLCPQLHLCDKTGAYGKAYVVVNDSIGAAVTTWDAGGKVYVYSTQEAAEAAYLADSTLSVANMGRAAQCIKDFNLDTYGRNEPGNGVLLLTGTHNFPGTIPASTLGTQNTWLTVTHHSQVLPANAVVNLNGSSALKAQRLRFYEVRFTGTGTVSLFGGSASTDVLHIDKCTWNTTCTNQPFGAWKLAYSTRNVVTQISTSSTGNGFIGGAAGSKCPFGLIRGNAGPAANEGRADGQGITGTFYTMLGNDSVRPVFQALGNSVGHAISDNAIAAYNTHYDLYIPWIGSYVDTPITHGNAFVQNLLERTNADDWAINMDEDGVPANNILIWHNTFAGSRVGLAFSWLINSFQLKSNYSQIGNIYAEYGQKDDTTASPNGLRTGSWSVGYHVGAKGNHRFYFAGTDQLRGEFSGLYTIDFGTFGFVNDKSLLGTGAGHGDYHLTTAASGFNLVPAAASPLPYDLEGTARNLSGGSAGAFESNVTGLNVFINEPLIGSSIF